MPLRTESPRRSTARRLRAIVAGSTLVLAATLLPSGTAAADPSPSAPGQAVAEEKRQAAALRVYERAMKAIDPGPGERAGDHDLTLAKRDLRLVAPYLPARQRSTARAASGRPGGNELCPGVESTHFKVHCVHLPAPTAFTPQDVLQAFDHVGNLYARMGYRRALPDGANGGNSKVDVYVQRLQDGLFGFCDTDQGRGATRWAYCVVNSTYAWNPGLSQLASLQATAAHEYFHAVQFAYDYFEDGWFMEGTAAWIEDEAYDAINDNRQFLAAGPLRSPTRAMARFDSFSGSHYGSWIFFRYLSERYGRAVVRDMWNRAAATRGRYSLQAIDGALRARRTNLGAAFAGFSDANRRPAQAYEEGAAYGAKPLRGQRTLRRVGTGHTFTTPRLKQLTSVTYRFDSRRLRRSTTRLRLAIDMPAAVTGSRAVVTVHRASGATRRTMVRLGRAGDRTMSVAFGSRDVRGVEVTLVNASGRMRDCGTDFFGEWSCFGFPRDNASVGTVRGVVVRR